MNVISVERIVVMGVAGSGKSTVAAALATRLGGEYIDADTLQPVANVAKMSAGVPLSDADRWPWLATVRRELRSRRGVVVVACSSLTRGYRDVLRGAGGVHFIHLSISREAATERVAGRAGHFMGASMIDSQFETLELPRDEEPDVTVVDASAAVSVVVEAAIAGLQQIDDTSMSTPGLAEGAVDRTISDDDLDVLVRGIAQREVLCRGAQKVLLVPPDQTRLHSRAGQITASLYTILSQAGSDVAVLPALGTHAEMTAADIRLMFGEAIPANRFLVHRWRDGLQRVGEVSGAELAVVSADRFASPIAIDIDEIVLDGWDLVVSIGQVVPHEVIGMANFTKNLVIGLGGAATIHRSHFLGAVCDMESIMGQVTSPVRDVVDAAFDRFIAPTVDVLWLFTVIEDTPDGVVQRGLFAGRGRTSESGGAAYRAAAALAQQCNIDVVPRALDRVVCWLDADEFKSTWLGNKAVYRTRMALADGGELIVLAPGVVRFGEDPAIDALIRRHGYRGTQATLSALGDDLILADNLGAAAHLIHGSSEGRFHIVYCTDPASGGLTRAEVESVGYQWRSLPQELARLGIDATTATGPRVDADGDAFNHIANPALGLWTRSAPV